MEDIDQVEIMQVPEGKHVARGAPNIRGPQGIISSLSVGAGASSINLRASSMELAADIISYRKFE